MISRKDDKGYDWIPWHYENEKQMTTMVDIVGGKMEAGDPIRSWSAEVFFPYGILDLLDNVPPESGTIWNANFCRLDYDSGHMINGPGRRKSKSPFTSSEDSCEYNSNRKFCLCEMKQYNHKKKLLYDI